MNIRGKNIILRAIEPEDNEMLYKLINDDETEYMLGGWSFPVSKRNQEDWCNNLRNEKNILRCTITVDNRAIGVIMLTDIDYKNGNAQVHIKLSFDDARGKGYGTDALLSIIRYAFSELRLKCIYAHVNSHNIASQRLFKKCGFNEEGVLRSRVYKKGNYIDVISYSILNKELE